MDNIADILKALRSERGMTQKQLADRSGMTIHSVRLIEQGVRANPQIDTVRRLFSALGVSLALLDLKPDRQRGRRSGRR